MGVSNCRICGKIFNYVVGQRVCEGCRKTLEAQFQTVKEYIRENPNSGIRDVSEATEVSENQIRQWVREERLEFSKGAGVLSCETCGSPIATGRFCERCKAKMSNSFNAVVDASRPQTPQPQDQYAHESGMRFIKN